MELIKFTINDKFKYKLPHLNEWVDYCPCDGISEYQTDKGCLFHFKIIDKHDRFLIVTIPNCGDENFESIKEMYKQITVTELEKDKMFELVNDFNQSESIIKIINHCLGESDLFCLCGVTLINTVVENYDDCFEIIKKINI
jgi:hypothetical protein